MSIEKQYTSLPDTLRGYESNRSVYKETESLFLTPDDFVFLDIEDKDFWYDNLGTNIIPLHGVTQFSNEDREANLKNSQQDYAYRTDNGKYQQRMSFDWSLDYHKLVTELNGTKLRVVYSSGRVLRATKINGEVKGLQVDALDLEKLKFHTNDSIGDSNLFLQLFDSNELNVNGYDIEVNWQPRTLDRLALNISVSYGADTMILGIKFLGKNVTDIAATDITIEDLKNGLIDFGLFVPGNGVYTLGNFSKSIVGGCVKIKSRIYIGLKQYQYTFTLKTPVNFELMDGSNFELMSGVNFDLMEVI